MLPVLAIVLGLSVFAAAAPQVSQNTPPPPQVLRSENNHNLDGSYNFNFETENRISAQEQGALKNPGTENEALSVQGSYSYTDLDGNQITVNYIADENGYQPTGDHLPQAPPIPPEIQEALARNAAEEANLSPQELEQINSGRYIGN